MTIEPLAKAEGLYLAQGYLVVMLNRPAVSGDACEIWESGNDNKSLFAVDPFWRIVAPAAEAEYLQQWIEFGVPDAKNTLQKTKAFLWTPAGLHFYRAVKMRGKAVATTSGAVS